ncbi:hypothetical protein [Nitriliruptor alkaliphilus]|uniref:hypothetical protein n=1 Tax=Nitriliruptor alkaliphilus TaxID=427918 RepID=UPI0012ECE5D3|nr:hypothetical protein [Nitriliruptor alkaliphilus]
MPDPDRPTAPTGTPRIGTPISATGRGYRRAVPPHLDEEARQRLRWLLDDPEHWVLRTSWERYLRTGDQSLLITTDQLTQDQRVAAAAWLGQQRHALHRAIEGGDRAPDGWLEELPMMRAFVRRGHPSRLQRAVPRQPGGPTTEA